MTGERVFVIVGAKAAEKPRAEGFDGRLTLIGTEEQRPYERPPLSKDYLRGELERERVYVHPAGFYADQGPGAELDGVPYLRDLKDSEALRVRMNGGGAVVVIGAGWIDLPGLGSDGTGVGFRGGRHLPRPPRRARRAVVPEDECGRPGGRWHRRARPHERRARARLRVRGRRYLSDHIQRLIRSRTAVDDRALADPEVALQALAPEAEGSRT